MSHASAREIIRRLRLKPLPPEGGFFRETHRTNLSTAIYYLLTPDTVSRLHRLPGPEVFHFYLGDPVTMLLLYPDRRSAVVALGTNIAAGQRVQQVVPGRVWQGAFLRPGGRFALLGTTMAPGFAPSDYESGNRATLVRRYPRRKTLIVRLTGTR
jgi:predicted cupin superfamily sugar epimerase